MEVSMMIGEHQGHKREYGGQILHVRPLCLPLKKKQTKQKQKTKNRNKWEVQETGKKEDILIIFWKYCSCEMHFQIIPPLQKKNGGAAGRNEGGEEL